MKYQTIAAWMFSIGALALSSGATAAEPTIQALTFKHPDGRSAPAEIYIDGEITPNLPHQLSSALGSNRITRGTIYLNSIGGDLQAAMALGEFIRKSGFNTAVGSRGSTYGKPKPGFCQSACIMVFAGGVFRFAEPTSAFGIHRFYSRANTAGSQDLALGQILSAAITGYLIRMGVAPELFERMVRAGRSLQPLPLPDAAKLDLTNNGLLPVRWEILGQSGRVFLQGEQRTWNGTGRVQVSCSRDQGLEFRAQYDADQNTQKILHDARHLSMRIDGALINIAPSALIQSSHMNGAFLTTQLRLSRSIAYDLAGARRIGFTWLPAETSIFYGFDLPVSGNTELISSFLSHCGFR